MHVIRSHIQKQDGEKRKDTKMDLDEKIRQIREKNKAREKRFKEIQDDKLNASQSDIYGTINLHNNKNQEKKDKNVHRSGDCVMPGICNTTGRRLTKGRGQRLLEISKEPLKAGDFESKTVVLEAQESITKDSNEYQRSSEHKNKSFHISDVGHNPILDSQYLEERKKRERTYTNTERMQNRKYGCFNVWKRETNPKEICESNTSKDEHGLHHKVNSPKTGLKGEKHDDSKSQKHHDSSGYDKEKIKPCDYDINIERKKTQYLAETLEDSNDNKNTIAKKDGDSQDILAQLTENLPTNLDKSMLDEKAEPSVINSKNKKADKPKITVNIKKTASTTSFDEVMSLLSPLDVPTNWGDCDFDDNDGNLSPITF